jgi:hypothetical protein
MKSAQKPVRDRIAYADRAFADIVVWQVPQPHPGSTHTYKYRLAFVVRGVCLLRYDNEAGKGDHRHARGRESGYQFISLDRLFADFERDSRRLLDEDSDA